MQNSRLVQKGTTRAKQVQIRNQLVVLQNQKEVLIDRASRERERGALEAARRLELRAAELDVQSAIAKEALALADQQAELLREASSPSRATTSAGLDPVGMLDTDMRRMLRNASNVELRFILQTANVQNLLYGDEGLSKLSHNELSNLVAAK